jgi:hypothetical protein
LVPVHEPQLPPQPSLPQFLPAQFGVVRAQLVVSVSVVPMGVHVPAAHVGVVTEREWVPVTSHAPV